MYFVPSSWQRSRLICDAMVRADMELAASGIAQCAIKTGDQAPDFLLPDARGGYVQMRDTLLKVLLW
jgi:hypothetical protein